MLLQLLQPLVLFIVVKLDSDSDHAISHERHIYVPFWYNP